MNNALNKAREFEKDGASKILKEEKALFHLCAPIGWINDPNGFSLFQKEYHLFYQYYPYNTVWGPMHWGHSKTTDFIKWDQLPVALAPDEQYDSHGCFSGTAIEHDGKHILMYTGVEEIENQTGAVCQRQRQCIAVGDGKDYKKIQENPVIAADTLPLGSSQTDFRDPKIWKEDGKFYAVVGSRAADGSGQIPLYESENLKEWSFVSILDRCDNEYGKMWECPDFFSLEEKHILILSPQDMQARDLTFHNGNGTMYIIGDYDRKQYTFTREQIGAIDFGLDFYAPQTLETIDGRRIMIGWMQNWDNHICPPDRKWSGMMSIPRELSIVNGKLYQNPVRELEKYYKDSVTETVCLNSSDKTCMIEGVEGRTLDFTVEIAEGDYRQFEIQVAKGEDFYTSIYYDAHESIVTFDRTYCGLRKDYIASRSMYVEKKDGKIKLRILLDRYSVEIFANDGAQAMTSLIATSLQEKDISFSADGECCFSVVSHQIVLS